MSRLILGIALLVVTAIAHADDDEDDVLEVEPMGPPIPERLESLEREWASDAGRADPADEGHVDPVEGDRPVASDVAADDDDAPRRGRPPAVHEAAGKKRGAADRSTKSHAVIPDEGHAKSPGTTPPPAEPPAPLPPATDATADED